MSWCESFIDKELFIVCFFFEVCNGVNWFILVDEFGDEGVFCVLFKKCNKYSGLRKNM